MTTNIDALQAAWRAAPGLDASTHVAIANSTTDAGDAATAAQAVQGMGEATTTVNTLRQLDGKAQNQLWNAANDNQRSMWQASGYNGPPKPSRSVIGSITHATFKGKFSPITGLKETAKSAFHALGAGEAAVQHAYRSFESIERGTTNVSDGGTVTTSPGVVSEEVQNAHGFADPREGWTTKFFSPNAWSKAWTNTKEGEHTFKTADYNKVQQQVEGHTINVGGKTLPLFDVARALSTGEIDDYAKAELGTDAQAIGDLGKQISSNPILKQTVTDLNNHKLSFGRMITPDSLWHSNPHLATALSGAGDAVFDIKTDPLLIAGKARKTMQAAKWGVKAPEDIDNAMASPQGQRWLTDVTEKLQQKDYAGLMNRFPSLTASIPDLARKGVTTPEQLIKTMKLPIEDANPENVSRWVKDNHTAARILVGDGSPLGRDSIMAPHLSVMGKKALDVKDWASKSIDWSQNVALPKSLGGSVVTAPLNLLGASVKKMTTLLPEGRAFDPNGADALTFVQRFSKTYLDKGASDAVVNAWAGAGYDTAAKRNIYMDMIGKVFEKAGMNDTVNGQRMMARYMTNTERATLRQKYAAGGIDNMVDDGQTVSHGITEEQLAQEWSLPSYKHLAAASQKGKLGKIVYGVSNNTMANAFNAVWKPATLLRVGFPIRVSIDEIAGAVLRNGVLKTVQARLAGPVARTLTEFAGELDPEHAELATKEGNALGVFAAHLAQKTKVGMAKVGQKVIPQDTYDAVKWGIDNGTLDKSFYDVISSAHHGGYLGADPDDTIQLMKDGVAAQKIWFQAGDDFREYEPGNDLYSRIWKWRLNNLGSSDIAQKVLENYDLPEHQIIRKVADHMQSEEWRGNWNRGARSKLLSDGRRVGVDGVTEDDAAIDWATKVKAMVDSTVKGQDGTVHDDIVAHLLEHRKSPDLDILDGIDNKLRPEALAGPEQVPVVMGGVGAYLKNFTEFGFNHIGKTIDWMARQPLYLHNFATAKKELTPLIEASLGKGAAADQVLKELVSARAIRNSASFIHNPAIRSQMNVLTQNFLPFQFAQEQFWKRWGRTFAHSPEALRKAQLATQALSTTGIVHDDGMGNQVFTYPATGHAQKAIAMGLNALGANVLVPVHGGFSGELKMIAPGFDVENEFAPAFGPLVSLPVTQIARFFPEMQPAETAVLGEMSVTRSAWEQIVPTTVARLIHLGIDQKETSTQYSSAMMKTIQDIAASKYRDPAFVVPGKNKGLLEKGNIDINHRPKVKNADGSISTVRSITIADDNGHAILLPTVVNGAVVSDDAAIAHYNQTGENLGKFSNEDSANSYAEQLHKEQANQVESLDEWYASLNEPDGKAKQEFLDAVKNGTRINVAVRALLGFAAPAAPTMDIGNTKFGERMRELQGMGLDFTTAQQELLRTDPGMTPYATYQSVGTGTQPLPATKEALEALEAHDSFFKDHPTAGGFFLPASASTDPFSAEAYRLQMAFEMRRRRTPEEMLDQLLYNEAAGTYFDTRDKYKAAVKNLHGPAKTANDVKWAKFADQWKSSHPVFSDMLASQASARKRENTFGDLQRALADPKVPQSANTDSMKVLVDTYANYLDAVKSLRNQNSGQADRMRKQWKATMINFAHGYTKDGQNVQAKNVYQSLIKPDLEGSD